MAIHVRRGDYVSNVKSFDFHGICEVTYYKNAIEQLNAKLDNPTYFIFSDDVQWVRNNFNFISNYTLVSDNAEQNNFEDFRLMRFCKHQIIANSTFSWWAAWLSDNPKSVIAPSKWFGPNNADKLTKDLFPEEWRMIDEN